MATTSGFVQQPTTSFNPGFTQAPQIALPEVARTFEVPKVPTHTQTFGVPQVPTTGGGFLAPSGPGQPVTSLAPSGPGQPATSTVPSLSPSSRGGSGLGTGAAIGGGAALAALLNNMGRDSGSDSFSIQNMLGGLSKMGKLTGITGDGSILDKFLPKGFDLTSLPENVVESVSNFLGLGGEAAGLAGTGNAMIATGGAYAPSYAGMGGMYTPEAISAFQAAPYGYSGAYSGMVPTAAHAAAAPASVAGALAPAATMGAGGFGGSVASAGHIAAIEGLTAAPGTSMMAAFAPAAIALGGIMALKMSSQKDPGTLAAEAERRFDEISATKSVAQKHGIQKAIDEFGYEQVVEYAPFFAPGAPGYTSPLLRDQRPDHAVLKEISADDPRGREILEFVASNRGDAPLQGNTAELIKQLDISTTPSARMRKEMDFVLKQRGVDEEHRDYGISSNTREFKKGFTDALVDSGELTRIVDEHGIEYIKPGNYYESMEGY